MQCVSTCSDWLIVIVILLFVFICISCFLFVSTMFSVSRSCVVFMMLSIRTVIIIRFATLPITNLFAFTAADDFIINTLLVLNSALEKSIKA